MTKYLFIALLAVLTLNTGCKLIYKQNVQQGNAHEQDDLDQVELGMSKKQVSYLLGTPAIHDPFHQDRWDYISMLSRQPMESAIQKVAISRHCKRPKRLSPVLMMSKLRKERSWSQMMV